MTTEITAGIKITVETMFQSEKSRPLQSQYLFAYRITIENESDHTVQLKRRHWYIFDSNGNKSEIEGEGVVGEKPVLAPGETHQYVSGCSLVTDMGTMYGSYQMERKPDGKLFYVRIPLFDLIAPYKMN